MCHSEVSRVCLSLHPLGSMQTSPFLTQETSPAQVWDPRGTEQPRVARDRQEGPWDTSGQGLRNMPPAPKRERGWG